MATKSRKRIQKVATVVGGILMMMPNGLIWIWGNMAVYTLSYVAVRLGTYQGLTAPWMTSLYVVSWIPTLMACNVINTYIAKRWLLVLGIVISDLAIFSSYVAVQTSFVALSLTYGLMLGMGTGLIYGNAMQLIIECADKDVGLLSCALQSSFSFGGVLMTQLLTWYANPHNEAPKLFIGQSLYFTQKDVVDRGPSIFLVYGFCSLALHTVGFLLMQCNPAAGLKHASRPDGKATSSGVSTDGGASNGVKEDAGYSEKSACTMENNLNREKHYNTVCPSEFPSDKQEEDYSTPKQMVKSSLFYVLWIFFFFCDFPYMLLTNYYKLYGQLWIADDHFLANLGTALIAVNALTRLLWGMAMDRYGVKNCFLAFLSTLTVTTAWFCFTAMVSQWLYLLACVVYGTINSALYGCFMATVATVYGKNYVSTNYALLLTSSVVYNVLAPVLVERSVTHLGWYYTFLSAGAFNLFNLILCVMKIPHI